MNVSCWCASYFLVYEVPGIIFSTSVLKKWTETGGGVWGPGVCTFACDSCVAPPRHLYIRHGTGCIPHTSCRITPIYHPGWSIQHLANSTYVPFLTCALPALDCDYVATNTLYYNATLCQGVYQVSFINSRNLSIEIRQLSDWLIDWLVVWLLSYSTSSNAARRRDTWSVSHHGIICTWYHGMCLPVDIQHTPS